MDVVGSLGTAVEVCLPMTSETSCIKARRVPLEPLDAFVLLHFCVAYNLLQTSFSHSNYAWELQRQYSSIQWLSWSQASTIRTSPSSSCLAARFA